MFASSCQMNVDEMNDLYSMTKFKLALHSQRLNFLRQQKMNVTPLRPLKSPSSNSSI